ncbi:uncharacterized protein LOC119550887 [Drosophila subpulchrella]|uniref:uncharacterized protein LOC119550887 n=1 Tax=Drosophila subpulchrella TaxID=1486046 RepID=UPI0018A12891|nr:uncharacterized protein LOC119550887 [Drosophila subpulchrella]
MSDEQFPHFQPRVSEENDEISSDMTLDRPMSPPPEEIVEAMEISEDPPSLAESEAPISATRRSASSDRIRKELQDQSSEPNTNSRKPNRGKVQKQRRALSGKHVITCRNCENPLICFPDRTKYFTCAEVDGQLFKIKPISATLALNHILKKHTKRAPSKKN